MDGPNWADIVSAIANGATALIAICAAAYGLYRWARPSPPRLNILVRPGKRYDEFQFQFLEVLPPDWGSATVTRVKVGKGLEVAHLPPDDGMGGIRHSSAYGRNVPLDLAVFAGQDRPSRADLLLRPRNSISSVARAQMFAAFTISFTSPKMRQSTQRVALDMTSWAESAHKTSK